MWFQVDTGMARHRKSIQAGCDGFTLHVAALGYCAEFLTDGHIPADAVVALTPLVAGAKARKVARKLVDAGYWEPVEDGYQIHDYLKHQPSREEMQRRRAQDRERQAAWRRKQKETRDKRVTNGKRDALVTGIDVDVDKDVQQQALDVTTDARTSAQPAAAEQATPETPDQQHYGDGPRPLAALISLGVDKATAQDLLTECGPEEIAKQVEWLPHRPGIRSKSGAIISAVRERWAPPEIDARPRLPEGAEAVERRAREAEEEARRMFPDRFDSDTRSAM